MRLANSGRRTLHDRIFVDSGRRILDIVPTDILQLLKEPSQRREAEFPSWLFVASQRECVVVDGVHKRHIDEESHTYILRYHQRVSELASVLS